MRILKLTGALLVVLAFTAVAAATASATETLWVWLPGAEGTAFTGKSKTATLQMTDAKKQTIICTASTTTKGEITTEKTLGLAIIEFTGCTSAGVAVNSEGDTSKVILVHVELHDCLIATGHPGILILVLPLHIEIPALKALVLVLGSLVALVEPANKKAKEFKLNVTQKEGKQGIEKCEGGTAETLLAELNTEGFKPAGEEAKEGSISFTATEQEAMV